MRHPCPWSCSCRRGPTAQSTSSGSWYSRARSSMCPCDPYLSPSTAIQCTWFVRTTPSLSSATVLKAGCISHFLPSLHLCGLCKKPFLCILHWHSGHRGSDECHALRSGRLMQTHSLTSRLCGHLRLGYLLAEDMFSLSGDQSVHQQHPQAARSHEYPKHHKNQPKHALLVKEMFSTTAKTLPVGTNGLSKQLLGSDAFWVAGSSGPAMCEWPFFQEAPSWEDCSAAVRDRFS